MIIVGFSLAAIAAAVFFSWYYFQQWRASRKSRASRAQYYQHQRGDRRYSQTSEPLGPVRWL
jgi:hypothetical protein